MKSFISKVSVCLLFSFPLVAQRDTRERGVLEQGEKERDGERKKGDRGGKGGRDHDAVVPENPKPDPTPMPIGDPPEDPKRKTR
jgi:hypothetical protein